MNRISVWGISLALFWGSVVEAQPQRERKRSDQRRARPAAGQQDRNQDRNLLGDADANPLAIGDAGVAWYTTWETGLAEAQRSNRPIFFMSAATTCSGVPGVF